MPESRKYSFLLENCKFFCDFRGGCLVDLGLISQKEWSDSECMKECGIYLCVPEGGQGQTKS